MKYFNEYEGNTMARKIVVHKPFNGEQVNSRAEGEHGDILGPIFVVGKKQVTLWAHSLVTNIGWEVQIQVSPDGVQWFNSSVKLSPTLPVAKLVEYPCVALQGVVSFPGKSNAVAFYVLGE